MRNLFQYLRDVIRTPLFWGCVILCAALHFTTICYVNDVGKEYTIFELLFHRQELWDAVSTEISLVDIMDIPLGAYRVMFMPVVVIFPFLNCFWAERVTGYSRFIVARIGKVRYAVIRVIGGVLIAGFVAAFGCVLAEILCVLLLPFDGSNIGKIWMTKTISYFLYGMIVSTPVLVAAAVFYNRYIVACVPFLGLYLMDLTFQKNGLARWQTSYFTYLYKVGKWENNVVVYAAAAVGLMIVFCVVLTKRRDGCV